MSTEARGKNPVKFWALALSLSAVVATAVYAAADRWSIAIDSQENLCLPPYRVWIIDKKQTTPIQGQPFAFAAQGLAPVFGDGELLVKIIEGMPGDEVSVTEQATTINGKVVAEGLKVAHDYGIDPSRYVRTGTIPDNGYWFFGRSEDSFDSRYWGSADITQIRGRAYPIW